MARVLTIPNVDIPLVDVCNRHPEFFLTLQAMVFWAMCDTLQLAIVNKLKKCIFFGGVRGV